MTSKEEALSPLLSLGGPFKCGFFFLIRLAWDSHTRIPILIAIIFMVCDIRMQLEIDFDLAVRRLPLQNVDEPAVTDDEDETDSEEDEEDDVESAAGSEQGVQRRMTRDIGVMQDLNRYAAGDLPHSTSTNHLSPQ